MCHGDDPSLAIKNSNLIGLLRGRKAILILTSPALRKASLPGLQTHHVPWAHAAVPLLYKGVTSTQTVCGNGETEAWHADVMHSGLLSLCPRPAGLPAGQVWDRGQGSPQHACANPSGQWGATSRALQHSPLSQQPGISSATATILSSSGDKPKKRDLHSAQCPAHGGHHPPGFCVKPSAVWKRTGKTRAVCKLHGSQRDTDKSSAVYYRDKFHLWLIQG